jgi:hypothetical protein
LFFDLSVTLANMHNYPQERKFVAHAASKMLKVFDKVCCGWDAGAADMFEPLLPLRAITFAFSFSVSLSLSPLFELQVWGEMEPSPSPPPSSSLGHPLREAALTPSTTSPLLKGSILVGNYLCIQVFL